MKQSEKMRLGPGKLVWDGEDVFGIVKDFGGNIIDVFRLSATTRLNHKVIEVGSQAYRDSYTREQMETLKILFDGIRNDK